MIDLTQVTIAVVGALSTIIGTVFLAWLQSHMKDQAAAATIGAAVRSSLGTVKQAVSTELTDHPLQVTVPGISAARAAGVQYVLDNAGPELARFPEITPERIAGKIEAQIGLAKIVNSPA